MTVRTDNATVEPYLPLVRRIAWRYRGAGLSFDDLVQEGSLGLLDALERFDPRRGVGFEAYASFRIRRAIFDALTERGRLVRLPKYVVERRHAIDQATARILAESGHPPTVDELAAVTGLSVDAVAEAQRASIDPLSLDEPLLRDGAPLEELVADPEASDPEQLVVAHDEAHRVDDAVAHLPDRQRYLVEHAFGFDTPPESIASLAHELHLSTPRTRAIVASALLRLRDELEQLSLLSFFLP